MLYNYLASEWAIESLNLMPSVSSRMWLCDNQVGGFIKEWESVMSVLTVKVNYLQLYVIASWFFYYCSVGSGTFFSKVTAWLYVTGDKEFPSRTSYWIRSSLSYVCFQSVVHLHMTSRYIGYW